ncbi:MAG: hypothetical protein KF758_02145 [Anaerolineales bacterium]|nr:hypothetical protein [Anaerolineales bacterium]
MVSIKLIFFLIILLVGCVNMPSQELSTIQYRCVNNANVIQFHEIDGTLIFLKEDADLETRLLLVKLNKGEEHLLPNKDIQFFSVSPNGMFLAFDSWVDNKHRIMEIIDSKGNQIARLEEPTDWYGFIWLNNREILINYPTNNNPFILLYPFTLDKEMVEAYLNKNSYAFSDTELIYDWGFYSYHRNIYDPYLTRIIYPSVDDKNNPIIVMRDIISNKDIVSFSTYAAWGVSPKWSPDGEKLAIGINANSFAQSDNLNKYEVFIIGNDGEEILSTNFSSFFESVYISHLSWSPDSQYIAFRYTISKNINENLKLAVLNTRTGELIDYCLESDLVNLSFAKGDTSPIWSPDSNFLIVEIQDASHKISSLIVDIYSGKSLLIKNNLIPVGWMK